MFKAEMSIILVLRHYSYSETGQFRLGGKFIKCRKNECIGWNGQKVEDGSFLVNQIVCVIFKFVQVNQYGFESCLIFLFS